MPPVLQGRAYPSVTPTLTAQSCLLPVEPFKQLLAAACCLPDTFFWMPADKFPSEHFLQAALSVFKEKLVLAEQNSALS